MIWTPDGVWYQYLDEWKRVRSSYCGRQSLVSVQAFAREHGLPLSVFRDRGGSTQAMSVQVREKSPALAA
jgi:hypothetical protein